MQTYLTFTFLSCLFLCNCSNIINDTLIEQNDNDTSVSEEITNGPISFIDEYIIPDQQINGHDIGGFSGLDYKNEKWYIISDASTAPVRFYSANIGLSKDGFNDIAVNAMTLIKDASNLPLASAKVDPESIRFDTTTNTLIYASEGPIDGNINPQIIEIDVNGKQLKTYNLPDNHKINTTNTNIGPRQNGTLEGLTLSHDNKGLWVSLEVPLKEDGPEPIVTDTKSPVRITYINKSLNKAERQFAYELDPVAREPQFGMDVKKNGLVELLAYDENKFIALERSFSFGYFDGGSTVKIYAIDATNATNTLTIDKLSDATYIEAKKTLLLNLDTIRDELEGGRVGNLEGITFGPDLNDGYKTLVLIADNNFNAVLPQPNQLLAFKIKLP